MRKLECQTGTFTNPDSLDFRLSLLFPTQKVTYLLVYSELITKILEFKDQETKVAVVHLFTNALDKAIKHLPDLGEFRIQGNLMVA